MNYIYAAFIYQCRSGVFMEEQLGGGREHSHIITHRSQIDTTEKENLVHVHRVISLGSGKSQIQSVILTGS